METHLPAMNDTISATFPFTQTNKVKHVHISKVIEDKQSTYLIRKHFYLLENAKLPSETNAIR